MSEIGRGDCWWKWHFKETKTPTPSNFTRGSLRRKGVEEGVTAKIVDYMPDLLASPSTEVCKRTWELLKHMVDYLFYEQLAFPMPLCGLPISHLCDGDCAESMFYILTDLSLDVAIDAEVLDGIAELLGARSSWVRVNSCKLAGVLAAHYSTMSPILQLVSILRTQRYSCLEASIYALCQISRSAHGLQVVIEANTLENLLELLERPLGMLPAGYCELLGALAGLDENAQTGLTALLGNTEIQPWTWWLVLRLVDREGSERPSDKRTLTTRESRLEKSLDSSHEHPPAPLQVARNWFIFASELLLDPPSKPPPKTLSEDTRMTGSGSDRSFKGAEVEERVFFMFSNVLHVHTARRVTLTALTPTALTPAYQSQST
ncbi:hypothetical protein B0H11DRAFT_2385481 [Mycena galericulata]|nr:hypothetical protein B0H11DRAFT_2385481 [Mycena galericulata]